MRVLDLFSGIGGLTLAAEWAGMETIAFCEIDPYCQKVLKKHWPDIPIFSDVKDLNKETLADAESARKSTKLSSSRKEHGIVSGSEIALITGGYPCQPFSHAGKRAGEGDDRNLWPEALRLVREIQSTWCVFENVAGHISLGLDTVLSDLEETGYACQPFVVPACAVNAPHRRDRVFIVGRLIADTDECGRSAKQEQEPEYRLPEFGRGGEVRVRNVANNDSVGCKGKNILQQGRSSIERSSEAIPYANSAGLKQQCGAKPIQAENFAVECESWWEVESRMGGSLDGFPDWIHRHIGLGMNYGESLRTAEELRKLWNADVSEALWKAIGGLDSVSQAQILFAFVRQHEKDSNKAWLLLESEKAFENFVRELWGKATASCPPYRSRHHKQQSKKHSDALQVVSQLFTCNGEANWNKESWEDGIARVTESTTNRVDRLRCLGNAVVPQQAYPIFATIMQLEK